MLPLCGTTTTEKMVETYRASSPGSDGDRIKYKTLASKQQHSNNILKVQMLGSTFYIFHSSLQVASPTSKRANGGICEPASAVSLSASRPVVLCLAITHSARNSGEERTSIEPGRDLVTPSGDGMRITPTEFMGIRCVPLGFDGE